MVDNDGMSVFQQDTSFTPLDEIESKAESLEVDKAQELEVATQVDTLYNKFQQVKNKPESLGQEDYHGLLCSYYGVKVYRGEVGLITGSGGSGKSSFACYFIQSLLSITKLNTPKETQNNDYDNAKGFPFMNSATKKILYVSAEEKTDLIKRRLRNFGVADFSNIIVLGNDFFDEVVSVYSCIDYGNKTDAVREGYTSKMFKLVEKVIRDEGVDLLLIDSLIRTAPSDIEHKPFVAPTFFHSITKMFPNTGVVFLHHSGKNEDSKARGTSSITDASRWSIYLKAVEAKDVEKAKAGATTLNKGQLQEAMRNFWDEKGIKSPFILELQKNNRGGGVPVNLIYHFTPANGLIQGNLDSLQRPEGASNVYISKKTNLKGV